MPTATPYKVYLRRDGTDSNWFCLPAQLFLDYPSLLMFVKRIPESYRHWSTSQNCTVVHMLQYNYVCGIAEKLGVTLELQDGPGRTDPISKKRKHVSSPYHTLYLMEGAPLELVKVVYRHLAKLYHPDCGGDEEQFKAITKAYEEITSGTATGGA